jgi:peptidoglycan/LPS O-acetylase OafA/YrhL
MKNNTTLPISAGPRHGPEIFSIQYLRALAAFGVFLSHASTSLLEHGHALIPMEVGTAGVDIFFVISGFIMYYTTVDRAVTSIQFYLRRLIRIVPLYFAFSTLAFFIARGAPHVVRNFSPGVENYFRSIFFIPYYNLNSLDTWTGVPLVRPEVGQGWTLNYEMFFYLLFGACLYLPPRFRVRSLVAICALLPTIGLLTHPNGAILRTYTDPLIIEFIFGVALGYIFVRYSQDSSLLRDSRWGRAAAGALLASASFAALIIQGFHRVGLTRVVSFGFPALGLVAGALLLERARRMPKSVFLLLLGNASYSFYLLHTFVLAILRRLWQHYFQVDRVSVHVDFMIVGALISETAGILVFLYIERPMTDGISALLKRRGILHGERRDALSA